MRLGSSLVLTFTLAGCASTGGGDLTSAVDALMRDYDGNVPGASVLVIRDGRAVVRKAYGLSDVKNGVRATPATDSAACSGAQWLTPRSTTNW